MPSPIAVEVVLSEEEREQLESLGAAPQQRAGAGAALADRACCN